MISVHLQQTTSERARAAPRILAVFSFRYDAHLVPDLIANITPLVDGWVSFDDKDSQALFSDEPARRRALLLAARSAGAQWILAADPDERFESAFVSAIPTLIAAEGPIAYSFAVREMFGTDYYRVDGIWGRKTQTRLFRMPNELNPSPSPLHSPWHRLVPNADVRESGFNIYHLKMITADRRRARADLYNHLDPERRLQPIGYDYLADERDAVFEKIPAGRGYQPPHQEDDGLWMPTIKRLHPEIAPAKTPLTSIFRRLTSLISRG
jgi:hypothetical protein